MGERKLVRLEKARDGGFMVKDNRKIGFPDRKFAKEVVGLKVGDEINIEVTGWNPKGTVFFWRWVRDDRPEEIRCSFIESYPTRVQVNRSYSSPLGVRLVDVRVCTKLEEAIHLGIEKTEEWLSFEKFVSAREEAEKSRVEKRKAARDAGPTRLSFREGIVTVHYGDVVTEIIGDKEKIEGYLVGQFAKEALEYLERYESEKLAKKEAEENAWQKALAESPDPLPLKLKNSPNSLGLNISVLSRTETKVFGGEKVVASIKWICSCGNVHNIEVEGWSQIHVESILHSFFDGTNNPRKLIRETVYNVDSLAFHKECCSCGEKIDIEKLWLPGGMEKNSKWTDVTPKYDHGPFAFVTEDDGRPH